MTGTQTIQAPWPSDETGNRITAGYLAAIHAIERFNASPTDPTLALNLSRAFRFRELHDIALPFAIHGLGQADPSDELYFMLKAEVATSGYYSANPKMRELGHAACEELTLSRDCHPGARQVAFQNLFHYTKKLSEYAPSFSSEKIKFAENEIPSGYYPTNPSITRVEDYAFLNVRCVNYYTDVDEQVILPKPERLRTRNILFFLNGSLRTPKFIGELHDIPEIPVANDDMPLGVEDIRLFPWWGDLGFSGTVVQANHNKMAEIAIGRIYPSRLLMRDWRIRQVSPDKHEKNWSPIATRASSPAFIYSHDPFLTYRDGNGLSSITQPPIAAHTWSGSTQAIPFLWGGPGWLVMIHEKIYQPDMKFTRRWYQQRFVWYDQNWQLKAISRRFQFDNGETEFPCGMCLYPDEHQLLISYGVLDREAWLATVSRYEVSAMLRPVS